MRTERNTSVVPIERVEVSAYHIPTDFPEADGTLEWDSTTLVVVEATADEVTGLGYTYADAATARLIHGLLADIVIGCDAMAVSGTWAVAEGYIPAWSHGPEPECTSHETLCFLNAAEQDAHVQLTIFYADRGPAGPYRLTVPARRTKHLRLNDLTDPEPIPRGVDYAS